MWWQMMETRRLNLIKHISEMTTEITHLSKLNDQEIVIERLKDLESIMEEYLLMFGHVDCIRECWVKDDDEIIVYKTETPRYVYERDMSFYECDWNSTPMFIDVEQYESLKEKGYQKR